MENIIIRRGKVIRVPAEIKLKYRQETTPETIPYIVGADEKVKDTVEKMWQMFLGEDEIDSNRRMDLCKLLWGFWFLMGTSSIEQILSGEEDFLKEKFSNAKFIARLDDLKSDTHNYYYIVEDLPEDWSVADVITCFANAQNIQEYLKKLLPKCSFEGCATLNFDDALPIAKIPKSKAIYVAAHQDDLYVARDGREISRINKALADLMILEIENSNASQIHLVRPVGNVRELFSVEHPELAEFLSKVSVIKKLDIQDEDNEYFYIVSETAGLTIVDLIAHQVAISRLPSLSSLELSTCKCSNCPYNPLNINVLDTNVLYNHCINFNPIELSQMKTDLNDLNTKPSEELNKSISQLLKVEKNATMTALLESLLQDESTKKKIIDFCTPEKKIEIELTISHRTTIDFYPASFKIKEKEIKEKEKEKEIKELTKGTKSRNRYAPYVLWIMALYERYLADEEKNENKDSSRLFSIFQFANEQRVEKIYTLEGRAYFNDVLALLFGVLYNIFSFDGFSTSRGKKNEVTDKWEDWRDEWLKAICKYLGVTNIASNDMILEHIGDIDIENHDKIEKVLYRDFNEFIGDSGQSNSYWSGAFLCLSEIFKKEMPLIGQVVMPKCEFTVTINNGDKNLLAPLEKAFFKLFAYLEKQ